MVLCACFRFGAMYIWCCMHDCISGVVRMWCYMHVADMILCTGGVMYMSWIWCCVYVIHVTVLCTFGVMYTLFRRYDIHVVLCTCCAGGVVYM